MKSLSKLCLAAVCLVVGIIGQLRSASGEVTVFSNRTRSPLTISVLADGTEPKPLRLEVGASRPVFYRSLLRVRYGETVVGQSHEVQPKSAYFFTRGTDGNEPLRMEQIGFGTNKPQPGPLPPIRLGTAQDNTTITVKIVVDDDEPTHRRIWEGKLRNRIAKASDIIEQHCGIKLRVVAVATWDSDDRTHDFDLSMREFEREVVPAPAQLAIGFSSQYRVNTGRHHVGGTRGVLYPYIMLKERSPKTLDRERLELLLHELGHYLGASHSPEPQSIMRPLLTSSLQRQAGSRIQYDPVNTLLMSLMAEEIRYRDIKRLSQVSRPTKLRMQEIYTVLTQALPKDPAAGQYLRLLGVPEVRAPAQQLFKVQDRKLVNASRRMLSQLVLVVEKRRPKAKGGEQPKWFEGDELTQFYVRRAALSALQTEPVDMQRVYLVTLGVFMDQTSALKKLPLSAAMVSQIENEHLRERRLKVLGEPTIHNRADLALHFFLSAHLTATLGPQAAFQLGLAKEISDANGGSGFSFADLAADRAGIEFAQQVSSSRISLETLSEQFDVANYMPTIDDLKEGLTQEQLRADYGDLKSDAFKQELAEIERRVLELPAYRRQGNSEN